MHGAVKFILLTYCSNRSNIQNMLQWLVLNNGLTWVFSAMCCNMGQATVLCEPRVGLITEYCVHKQTFRKLTGQKQECLNFQW